jgi:hypothetical protein
LQEVLGWPTEAPADETVFEQGLRGCGDHLADHVRREDQDDRIKQLPVMAEDLRKPEHKIHRQQHDDPDAR